MRPSHRASRPARTHRGRFDLDGLLQEEADPLEAVETAFAEKRLPQTHEVVPSADALEALLRLAALAKLADGVLQGDCGSGVAMVVVGRELRGVRGLRCADSAARSGLARACEQRDCRGSRRSHQPRMSAVHSCWCTAVGLWSLMGVRPSCGASDGMTIKKAWREGREEVCACAMRTALGGRRCATRLKPSPCSLHAHLDQPHGAGERHLLLNEVFNVSLLVLDIRHLWRKGSGGRGWGEETRESEAH